MFNVPNLQPLELTDSEFERISRFVYDRCGINLNEGKRELVRARLGKRIRKGQFKSFQDYYQYVIDDDTGREIIHLLDSISTNYTFFFREQKHFDYLRFEFLPELMDRKQGKDHSIRIWSAGCSSGEEPYSIVISIMEMMGSHCPWEASVLGTDLSTRMLGVAESGVFHRDKTQSLPQAVVAKYFLRGDHQWQDYVKIKDEVKKKVRLERLNLIEPFYFKKPFDCIFCRNVMIYFDKKTQSDLVRRLYECLAPGGTLLIGHSESLTGIVHPFTYVRPAIYRK